MGGLFGKKNKAKPEYTGIQVQTAASTLPVPLLWGAQRIAPNLFWYNDFAAHKQKQKTGKGGASSTVTYTYTASIMMGLCEGGPDGIEGIGKTWVDMTTTDAVNFSSLGFTLFYGTSTQTAWSYVTTNHPTEAIDYKGFAYIAAPNYDLGSSASTPQHSFEVLGMRYQSFDGVSPDADVALIIEDFLTLPSIGVGFPSSVIDDSSLYSSPSAPTTGDSAFQTYCKAMGFALSPALVNQEAASDTLMRWTKLCNTAIYWNGYLLKFIPYGDSDVTANGVTWLAPTTVTYTLTDSDFVKVDDGNPVKMKRSDPAELKNIYRITVKERANSYNDAPVEWRDLDLVEKYGERADSAVSADEVCDIDMAGTMVQLYGMRQSYVRNSFKFTLDERFIRLEPMDIAHIYDEVWGVVPVRMTAVEENEEGKLECEADEYPQGSSSSTGFGTQPISNNPQNQGADPGPVNTPIIFEPPTTLTTNGAYEIWMAVSGGDDTNAGPYWGGAYVWVSTDDATYTQVGTVEQAANMGVLTATLASFAGTNPDTSGQLKVNLLRSSGLLSSVSSTDAALNASICYVGGELLSYTTATLTGTNAYTLTDLYRGQYQTTSPSHASGTPFSLLDTAIFKLALQPQYVGQLIYVKFQSFNLWGGGTQELSDCVAYTYTPTGGGTPAAPTSLSATGGSFQNNIVYTASVSPNVTEYDIYAYHGLSTDFNDGTLIGTTNTNSFAHVGLTASDQWTYWVTAKSLGGESSPAGPVNATTLP